MDIQHALEVASRVESYDAKIVALLHDVVEDGDASLAEVRSALKDDVLTAAIDLLTRGRETYFDYIENIKTVSDRYYAGVLARQVKLADLDHNLTRYEGDSESLLKRWRKAQEILR